MKYAISLLAVLLILVGLLWIFQGINVVRGSFMSGHSQYAILGIVVDAIGISLLYFANRRSIRR